MKKLFKLLSVALILGLMLTLTSCQKQRVLDSDNMYENLLENAPIIGLFQKEGYTFVGYLSEDGKTLYTLGSNLPKGKFEKLYVENKKVENNTYSYPSLKSLEKGKTFAGWYTTQDFKYGTRVATTSVSGSGLVLYAKYITFADAVLITVVCMAIVFMMLALLWGIVALFKYLPKGKEKKVEVKKQSNPSIVKKAITLEDIKDDDMMAAALVATIDYHEQTGENVRVTSIKQIG